MRVPSLAIHSFWFLLFLSKVFADVSISTPGTGKTFSGSSGTVSINVTWVDDTSDSSDDTSLDGVSSYAIVLCTGSSTNIKSVYSFTTTLLKTATTYDAELDSTDVPDGYYFIQVYAKFSLGYTIHYTPRFKLTGMEGTATFTFAASLLSVTGDAPSPQLDVGGDATSAIDSKSFTVPYTEQTGRTRYAPMQTQPGSSISHSMYSTRHATSAYTPYSSLSPSPNVYSTITPGWSYTVTSVYNTAAVAAYPTYYYPASSRVVAASMSAAKKKRWID